MIRANVMGTLGEDYVRTARAKGAPEPQVMRSHVLRNALLPVVTMLGMDIGIALGGAIFTETIFGLPGLGRLAVQSLETFDLPMIQGVVVFSILCIIVFSIVVDMAYAWIDPRLRLMERAAPCGGRAGSSRRRRDRPRGRTAGSGAERRPSRPLRR
jgi:peptide/nickel transport system permease protein